jgi:N-acetylglucosamine-6-sulfatase
MASLARIGWALGAFGLLVLVAGAISLVTLSVLDGEDAESEAGLPPVKGPGAEALPPGEVGTEAGVGVSDPPNIVFILADDQTTGSFTPEAMPETFSHVVEPGTNFTSFLATPPLCCPYRAGFITGQYPHNHGVTTNRPGYSLLREPGNVLPVWLRQAGYRTAMIGMYLNKTRTALGTAAAPGWDEWYSAELTSGYWRPSITTNERIRQVPGYATEIFSQRAATFIENSAKRPDPFFVWLPHLAPHVSSEVAGPCGPASPKPKQPDYKAYGGPSLDSVVSPAFNETSVADKPGELGRMPRLDAEERARMQRRWRCAVASLAAVDRGVGDVVSALERTAELDNTIIIYGSDNGFFFGEHRLTGGKAKPYDPAWRVPFAMRVPDSVLGAPAAAQVDATLTQMDLTATLLELTGAGSCALTYECRRVDGRSFAGILRDPRNDGWTERRPILYELWPDCDERDLGVRTDRFVYAQTAPECGGGDRVLFDLDRDPHQLHNLAQIRTRKGAELLDLAVRLRRCSGVEGRDPRLPNVAFCN